MSTKVIEGVVKVAMNEKKFGAYGSMLEEYDGKWLNSTDRREDILQPGNRVKLKVQQKGKGYTILGAKLLEEGAAPARGKGGGKSDLPQIRYSAALKNAVPAAGIIIANGGMNFGSKAKAEDKKLLILALINELTAKYFKETDELTAVSEEKEIDADLATDENVESDVDDMFEDDDDF